MYLKLTSVDVAVALGLEDKPAPDKEVCVAVIRPRLAGSSSLIGTHVYIAVGSSCHSEMSYRLKSHTMTRLPSLLHAHRHMSVLMLGY